MADGRVLTRHIRVNSGAGERAMTAQAVAEKFFASASLAIAPERAELIRDFGTTDARLDALFTTAAAAFPGMVTLDASGFAIPDKARPLARMIARAFDAYDQSKAKHSAAI